MAHMGQLAPAEAKTAKISSQIVPTQQVFAPFKLPKPPCVGTIWEANFAFRARFPQDFKGITSACLRFLLDSGSGLNFWHPAETIFLSLRIKKHFICKS